MPPMLFPLLLLMLSLSMMMFTVAVVIGATVDIDVDIDVAADIVVPFVETVAVVFVLGHDVMDRVSFTIVVAIAIVDKPHIV